MSVTNIKFAVYKIFNGVDFDTVYFKAPASAITESSTQQFISASEKSLLPSYLHVFNEPFKLVKLNKDGKIDSDLINADFTDYLDKRATAPYQKVDSEVRFTHADGILVPSGINIHGAVANDLAHNSIRSVTIGGVSGLRMNLGSDISRQEVTFLRDGNLSFSKKTEIKNIKEGADSSAVPKSYVDNLIESGARPIASVKAASTENYATTPSGTTITIDGVSVDLEDRVLLKNQEDKTRNGIYVVKTGNWIRFGTESNLKGALVFVEEGTINNDSKYYHEGAGEWIKFSQTDQVKFTGGLTRSGDNVRLENQGIANYHIAPNASIVLSKLASHTGDTDLWDDNVAPTPITQAATVEKRLNDLAMTIYRIRGDVSNPMYYGQWNNNSLSLNKVNNTALDKQNPVRYGETDPTALSTYKKGDIFLLYDQTT